MCESVVHSRHFTQRNPSNSITSDVVGIKARGLLELPEEWTIPFFVIPVSACLEVPAVSEKATPLPQEESTSVVQWQELESLLHTFRQYGFEDVIVRSSCASETLDDRGLYESRVCRADLAEVLAAGQRIREQAEAITAGSSNIQTEGMAIVVQGYVLPHASGHLSNERRVSKDVTYWTLEIEVHESGDVKTRRFRVKKKDLFVDNSPLECDSLNHIQVQLTRLASKYSLQDRRVHVEWIWDGSRIWIVQLDDDVIRDATSPPGTPPNSWRVAPLPTDFAELAPAATTGRGWSKTKCIQVFRNCNLPCGNVLILEGEESLQALTQDTVSDGLRDDLERLIEVPVVIRTDVDCGDDSKKLLLPRTDAIVSVPAAIDFLCRTSRELSEQGISLSTVCFLMHRLIPAQSGAYAYAKPHLPRVRVDSLWGSPDGLNYYTHDSFDIDVGSNRVLKRHIRGKTHYIDLDGDGCWVEKLCGKPWDWKASVEDQDLFSVAGTARKIADHYEKPVAVMFFVGIDPRTKLPRCVPWFVTPSVVSEFDQEDTQSRFAGKRFVISCLRDLDALQRRMNKATRTENMTIRLRPKPELLRSTDFLKKIADVSKSTGLPVELEGSILSHAYYVLRREGVRLRCVDVFEEATDRQEFGKLVRDRIPLRIESHGEEPRICKVTRHELIALLKAKAVEEAFELFWENDSENMLEELADLQEVVDSTCRVLGRSPEQLKKAMERKRQDRGGFDEGVVLLETRAVPLIRRDSREGSLFEESDEPSGSVTDGASSMHQRISESRTPRRQGADIMIPLVPPDQDSRVQPFPLPLSDGKQELVISYERSSIRVTVRPIQQAGRPDDQQLLLPFPEDD